MIGVWKSTDADLCHLVGVHTDVPGAAFSIVVAAGVVKAGEGARLSGQLLRTTAPRIWACKRVTEKDACYCHMYS